MFGFLKKVGKGSETPASPDKFCTPGAAFSHTPDVRNDPRSSRHKSVDRFMMRKK